MRMYDVIYKKRKGEKLTEEEIAFFISSYVSGDTPDYQASAFLMACFLQDLDEEETYFLTRQMLNSGHKMDLSALEGIKVDKHSTGGVGDKTSLTLAPLIASLGLIMAKMSGRGLGHTGGTIDKLESIPGFVTELREEDFIQQSNDIGLALISQTKNLVPADKLLYALRDVTATVDHPALIASSIMSKKLAAGTDYILLDVKVGSGAFLKNIDEAIHLAKIMVSIGERAGKKTRAIISSMDQPLGYKIGNSIEVEEAIELLQDKGPQDLKELTLVLSSQLLIMAGKCKNMDKAYEVSRKHLESGYGYDKFLELVKAQGGKSLNFVQPLFERKVYAPSSGYIESFDTQAIGESASILGAGRKTKDEAIDLTAGIYLPFKIGDYIKKGDLLAKLYSSRKNVFTDSEAKLLSSIVLNQNKVKSHKLIRALVYEESGQSKVEMWS
ncbi:MAG TPA: thymidine phosphorylase [Clostridia bacterium]|nr:thymidine phosphorylase [Clostridia bacterium]